jgi:rare lipoprotein A
MLTGRGRVVPAVALLPLLAACTLVGYPAPPPPGPSPAAPPPPSAEAPPEQTSSTPAIAREYEVRGERYAILASAVGYKEMGLASWYGDEFRGRPTSSGEIYDPNQLTAAHRSLPIDTWVEVTNLSNGRKVQLRINDRGPFTDPHLRIIDVSHAAARDLGMIGLGLARVEVVALPSGAIPPGY